MHCRSNCPASNSRGVSNVAIMLLLLTGKGEAADLLRCTVWTRMGADVYVCMYLGDPGVF